MKTTSPTSSGISKCPTGIRGLDEITEGGLPRGRPNLVCGGAGSGKTPRAVTALDNLRRLCEDHLPDRYRIHIIDLLQRPLLAKGDQIVAVPALVRRLPQPVRKIIGDLSNTQRVLVGLDIRPRAA
jgi:circadian clock protein KaiB